MALSNEQKAAGRKSASLIAALLAANFATQSPAAVALKVTVLEGDRNIKVTGTVMIGSDAYPVAFLDEAGAWRVRLSDGSFISMMVGPAGPAGAAGAAGATGATGATPTGAVATLPAAATRAGARHFVTDSTVAASGNFGAAVTGGGSNIVPVYSDGTSWRIG